jgi:hypothetical protein
MVWQPCFGGESIRGFAALHAYLLLLELILLYCYKTVLVDQFQEIKVD